VLERPDRDAIYSRRSSAMLAAYALGLIIREVVRTLIGGPLPVGARAMADRLGVGDDACFLMSARDRHHDGPGSWWEAISARHRRLAWLDPGCAENPSLARASGLSTGDLWRDLRVSRRPAACRARIGPVF